MPVISKAACAHFAVAVAHRIHHLHERNFVGEQAIRIDVDLVLLHEPANRGDFRHTRHTLQPVAQVPVVKGAQLLKIVLASLVHQSVLESPTDARGIRSELRRDAFGELAADLAHVFEHARPAPVDVGAFIEHHVDIREAVIRTAPHDADVGCRQHR